MPPVYISYRPEDALIVEQIVQRCVQTYGRYSVILHPVESCLPDIRLEQHVDNLISGSSTVLIVIGQHWAGLDRFGRFRLSTADVPIRAEVWQALRSPKQVLVVLVNGATLPAPELVPDELHGLFALPVLELRSQHLRHDLNHLIHPPTLGQYLRYLFSLEWTRRYTR